MADAVNLQHQVRQNNEELQDFLKDLYKWEDEVQAKDKSMINSKSATDSCLPVRNKSGKKNSRSRHQQRKSAYSEPRLKGSDFEAWAKYDVDEALRKIDEAEEFETLSTSDEDSDDEELAEHRRLQKALFEKEKGNELFKEGKYEAAINRYTAAIQLDPCNPILPANRAMALIKVDRYGAAIQDCDSALALDSTYIKAYARRATANYSLGKVNEALQDYEKILKFQPGNKQALNGIEKIKKIAEKELVEQDSKPEELKTFSRKKKEMKWYEIREIGVTSSDEENAPNASKTKTIASIQELDDGLSNLSAADKPSNCIAIRTITENTNYTGTDENLYCSSRAACRENQEFKHNQNFSDSDYRQSCHPRIADISLPVTSIQFQTTWKSLENDTYLLYEYLKAIDPKDIPKFLGASVESGQLIKILLILRDYFLRDSCCIFNQLKYLSQVKRFSMTLMFLSADDKLVINDLFGYLQELPENERTFTEEDLQSLRLKYGVK